MFSMAALFLALCDCHNCLNVSAGTLTFGAGLNTDWLLLATATGPDDVHRCPQL